ncbi:MotA/TolQ/ExbB proton channel family protein [Flavivirga algicola]|uniref:MotA/TolQ/ExbB proton channel family protein n=1 Tax=Flavivirga algicola TaxID=2729136 RepID=A0ABX1RU36_9FLAO|nr:MotA/TolQ/ExbB proton channel family protein [Flavivirga algicola]NMH87059.1 MotA/TolQ/ExbB proton channel family protein [Flavivirga algicola]
MIDFLNKGGYVFMLPLTLLLLINIIIIAKNISFLFANKFSSKEAAKQSFDYIFHIGLFALTLGLLGQIVGLYEGFESIENWGNVDADFLFKGIAVSAIPAIYGLGIFIVSYVFYLLLKVKLNS